MKKIYLLISLFALLNVQFSGNNSICNEKMKTRNYGYLYRDNINNQESLTLNNIKTIMISNDQLVTVNVPVISNGQYVIDLDCNYNLISKLYNNNILVAETTGVNKKLYFTVPSN